MESFQNWARLFFYFLKDQTTEIEPNMQQPPPSLRTQFKAKRERRHDAVSLDGRSGCGSGATGRHCGEIHRVHAVLTGLQRKPH